VLSINLDKNKSLGSHQKSNIFGLVFSHMLVMLILKVNSDLKD
jgi:hypothetical protein